MVIFPVNILFFFKTSSRRFHDMSSRRLQDVFKMSSRRVFKTFSRRLQRNNFLFSKTSSRRLLARYLQHVFKTSSGRICKTSTRCFQDAFKTSWKTKNCYAEDVLQTSLRYVLKTSSKRVEYQRRFAGMYGKLAHGL